MLELGCARGVNLMAIAARAPEARLVGIDIDPAAIDVARHRADAAGLNNVDFRVGDVSDDTLRLEPFDYVLVHGVFSWVPDAVRDALLRLVRRALSPQGIAYLSYDAKPGACVRDALGHAIRAAGCDDAAQMREMLGALRGSPALEGMATGLWLDAEIDAVLSRPGSYAEHQFGAAGQRSFWVSEVWDWWARHGLQYLDDVAPTGLDSEAVAATRATLAAKHADRPVVETLLDVAIMRQFRATVLVRDDLRPRTTAGAVEPFEVHGGEVSPRPAVLPLTRLEARELGFVSTPELGHRTLAPLHAFLIEHLDGTRDPGALVALANAAVSAGELPMSTVSGAPPNALELAQGLPMAVDAALRDLRESGLLVEPR